MVKPYPHDICHYVYPYRCHTIVWLYPDRCHTIVWLYYDIRHAYGMAILHIECYAVTRFKYIYNIYVVSINTTMLIYKVMPMACLFSLDRGRVAWFLPGTFWAKSGGGCGRDRWHGSCLLCKMRARQ
jgi:hypothetical protein